MGPGGGEGVDFLSFRHRWVPAGPRRTAKCSSFLAGLEEADPSAMASFTWRAEVMPFLPMRHVGDNCTALEPIGIRVAGPARGAP